MKIAVNTRFLLHNKLEGIGWFTHETLRRIVAAHPEHEFYFLFDRPYHKDFIYADNVHPVVVGPPARHPFLWYWWFEHSIPAALKRIQPDVLVSTDGYLSLNTNVPQLVVFHDLAFEHFDDHHSWLVKKYYRHFTPKFAHKAARIATVSQYSKQDIASRYGVVADKIDVLCNGANERYRPLPEALQQQVREKYTGGQPYFVYAGSIHPRKNVARLLQAFDAFKTETNSDVKLLLVGAKGWKAGEVTAAYNSMQHKKDVVFAGHIHIDELAPITASALGMMYVSLFEGFGIPIVEAMQAGTPVITSNTSSMPEVAGDAALIVAPTNTAAITNAMRQLYTQPELRQQLIAKGYLQAQKYSWDIAAERLWSSIKRVLG